MEKENVKENLNKLKNHVLSIVEDIEQGRLEAHCSCGHSYCLSEHNECPKCGEDTETTYSDYLCNALDIEWILNSDKTLKGARILVAFGGPNIYIDTCRAIVEGYWWGESYSSSYNVDNMELEESLDMLFNC